MPKFKQGDKVRRIGDSFNACKAGKVYTVKSFNEVVHGDDYFHLEEIEGTYIVENFETVLYPNPPHKHAELIKAWADGAEIEHYTGKKWIGSLENRPMWSEKTTYRIKPAETTAKEKAQAKLDELMKKAEELQKEIEDM